MRRHPGALPADITLESSTWSLVEPGLIETRVNTAQGKLRQGVAEELGQVTGKTCLRKDLDLVSLMSQSPRGGLVSSALP